MGDNYLKKILDVYSKDFDIYENYKLGDEIVSAYGYFSSLNEKYLLVREVQLWETKTYEHIVFIEDEKLDFTLFSRVENLIKNVIEPTYIRKDNKYPEKNHMYSYITIILLVENIEKNIIPKIEKYKFEKSYLFSFRGYSLVRYVVIDLKKKNVLTNRAGKCLSSLYKNLL